jgi:hypothetical protein
MKNKILSLWGLVGLCAVLMALAACQRELEVTVTNSLGINRPNEMVELPNPFPDAEDVVVTDERGRRVPSQITYEGDVIFLVSLGRHEMQHYTIRPGHAQADTLACGRVYEERDGDLAWENNLVAFRAYGPALQARGEQAYGYDIFAKRGPATPMLEELYDNALHRNQSYHEDHGRGLDCYAVGPTLGAGASALRVADSLLYPRSYRSVRILDNGPLRFTAELAFEPYTIDEDTSVVEMRRITLDVGSHLNRTVVFFKNLTQQYSLVTGLALHDEAGAIRVDAKGRYMAYEDPTQGVENGKLMMGVLTPDSMPLMRPVYFTPEERIRRGAYGHLQTESTYQPGHDYIYYWGFAWNRTDIRTMDDWEAYLDNLAQRLQEPLMVSYKIE